MRTPSDLVLVRTRPRTSTAARLEVGDPHSSTVTLVQKHQSLQELNSRTENAIQNSKLIGSTKSLCNLHFSTRHALPLTFVRFLRPRISRGNRAKWPRNEHEEGPIHGPGRALNLGVSLPHPQTRQVPVRIAATAAPQTCPCPRSVRIHRLPVAINPPKTGHVLAQSTGSQRAHPSPELIRALDRSCPTGDIVQAAFSPRSRKSSPKGANAYVLI